MRESVELPDKDRDILDALAERYCPKCRTWYNVKLDAKKHAGH